MESADFVLKPTVFERAHALGLRTALVTSKDKVRNSALRTAAPTSRYSAKYQIKSICRVNRQAGEHVHSAQVNYWSLRAARHVLKNESVDLMYLSTTDYMMHTYAAERRRSNIYIHSTSCSATSWTIIPDSNSTRPPTMA